MPNIKIRVEKGQETAGDGREVQEQQASTRAEKIAVTSIFANQMMNVGKQIVNYSINNVGNLTGDYIVQSQINQALDVFSDIATIGTGFATGGWIGGVVAATGVAIKKGVQFFQEEQDIRKANRQSAYLRERTGNATTNNSRGTEN